MFERNRIDNPQQNATVAAEITLANGEVSKGRFHITAARTIYDVLNSGTQFLEFESYDGDRSLIAKATLASIKIVSVPQAGSLSARTRDGDGFSPRSVLGVGSDASWDDIRHAYLALSKTYHPDRFAGVALPSEVRDYLAAMARRINTAYAALEAPQQSARRAVVEKAQPIFTSRPI